MNQLSPGPHDSPRTGPDTTAGTATAPGGNAAGNPDAAKNDATKYDAVAGPFTIRDLTVFGSTLLMFVASLLPMFGERYNLWNLGNLFFLLLGIILPLVVVALFVARRLQPGTIVRVGSLSVDQFASVTASFAFPLFFLTIANSFNGGVLLGLIGSVGLLAATVLAPHLPWLSADFKGRTETPAHVVAREAAVPSRKPAAPKAPKEPTAPKTAAGTSAAAPAPGFQGSTPGHQAPGASVHGSQASGSQASGFQVPAAAAAAASTGAAPTGAQGTGASGAGASSAGAAGAGGAGATGSSPFAPPASYGAAQSAATEAPAVVHSADGTSTGSIPSDQSSDGSPSSESKPAEMGSPSPAGSATSQAPAGPSAPSSAPTPAQEPEKGAEAATEAGETPAAAEPATTQHVTQPAAQQPASQQPAAQQPWAATMATPIVSGDTRRVSDSIGATVDPASRPEESDSPHYEAFWFAVAQPRTAYDEHSGAPAFSIEPGGWVLALEDRGHEFLVQDTDGKVGVLRELSNIERG
ncbi:MULTISPECIES: hypothetical protein [unclassified Arthrobacter]|uniref:hypothetical protein n=1 Tax=unclassified Arthrobacter TaxID=235627 RepID=UPI002882D6D0|nr:MULTISPECIES: hypothetical protein [unclassified Arthrobacter]